MYQQVVYTRCKPRRELLDVATDRISDGKVIVEEGYAIHNFSQGILEDGVVYDPLFLESVMKKKNAAKEMGSNSTGVFVSYEYFFIPQGKSFLGHEYLRPYNATDVRLNGQKHRPGNYIKQYLVGDFDNYPCLLFGGEEWSAHKETENFYYHDNGEPLVYLPEVNEKYSAEREMRNKVRQFISEGREECVKFLVATVISEMSKGMNERNFIVIKDIPENVELWVAAVELSLPVYLARQISFSTNVVASPNLSADNVFYCNDKGYFIKGNQKDARESGGEKKYYSMLLGIHPIAQGSANITMGMNNVSYILLDGERKVIENKTNTDISKPYYGAVSEMNDDIGDFDKLLGELSELQFGPNYTDIYELFDAYKYMLDSESVATQWDYKLVKKYLSIFKKYEKMPYKWSQYLAEKTYGVYKMFLDVDVKEGLTLLKQIISMDHATKLKSDIETLLLDKYLYDVKTRAIDVEAVTELNKLVNTVYTSMPHIVAQGIKESITSFIDLAEDWNAGQSFYIFTKLYESNNSIADGNQEWYREELNERLVSLLFDNIYQDNSSTLELMKYVKNSSLYLELAIRGIERDFYKWSNIISSTVVDSKLELICGAVLEVGSVDMKQYEDFMICLLNASKSVSVLLKYLIKATEKFGVVDSSTEKFICSYIEIYGRRPSELKMLIESMIENDYGKIGEELAYEKIVEYINSLVSVDNQSKVLVKEFEIWRNGLKKPQGRAYTIIFAEEIASANSENIQDVLEKYLSRDSIVVDDTEMQWILSALGTKKADSKVFVRIYHLIKDSGFTVRKQLFEINWDDTDELLEYMRLYLSKPYFDWRTDYQEDIQQIEEDIYRLIRNENLDKVEKALVKNLDKKSPEVELLKEYFEELKKRLKEEKETEKQKEKELKKEAKKRDDSKGGTDEKKGLFSKIFSKK